LVKYVLAGARVTSDKAQVGDTSWMDLLTTNTDTNSHMTYLPYVTQHKDSHIKILLSASSHLVDD